MKVFIIVATTADGYIARDPGQVSTSWTSGADKKHFVEKTKSAGVIVMGLNTYMTIGRPLPGRLNIVYAPLGTPQIEGVEMTNKDPLELVSDLEKRGFKELAVCGGAGIYTLFLKAGLVDTIYQTVEPIMFGSGIKFINESLNVKLKLADLKKLSDDVILLEWQLVK